MTRVLLSIATILIAVSLVLLLATRATAHNPKRPYSERLSHRIDHRVRTTHHCQRLMGIPRTRSHHTYRYTRSIAYRRWALALWQRRANKACGRYRYLVQVNNDWVLAVNYAARFFPRERQWLLSCSSSEGGYGHYVSVGNGEGWMQFLHGTFNAYVGPAFETAHHRGAVTLPQWRSIRSRAGQALTAAYMSEHGQRHQWYGRKC